MNILNCMKLSLDKNKREIESMRMCKYYNNKAHHLTNCYSKKC